MAKKTKTTKLPAKPKIAKIIDKIKPSTEIPIQGIPLADRNFLQEILDLTKNEENKTNR